MKKEYLTESKKLITDFLREHSDRHFTIEQITDEVCREGAGKSTVYRQMSKLLEAGTVRRFETPEINSFVYQFADNHGDCDSHYHLKCVRCGRLIHMRCAHLDTVRDHIMKKHDFIIGSGKSVIYGECTGCLEKEKEDKGSQ